MSFIKKIVCVIISALFIVTLASCSNGGETEVSDGVSETVSTDKNNSIDPSLIMKFPEEKQSHDVLDDENFYLKVQTIDGNKAYIREMASKGKDAYSSLKEGDKFEWYYSNGTATFVFDDSAKTYEIYDINPLFIVLFSENKVEDGECVFFDTQAKYVKYKLNEDTSILHYYRKSDMSWIGFQYMYKDKYAEANLVLEASDKYPDHAVFSIPDDYTYYFEDKENEVSINWD